jgi:hypothetical protein
VRHLPAPNNQQKGVERNGKHEKSTTGISYLEPKALEEACCRAGLDLVGSDPPHTDQKGKGLLEISQDQVINQDDILVVTDISLVVFPPENESIGNEREQRQGGNEGEECHNRDCNEASPLGQGQWVDIQFHIAGQSW